MSQRTLAESPAAPELSLDEWFALAEDEPGELVNGHLEEEEVPDYLHELLVALLVRLLGNWIFPQGGLVAGSDAKFAVASQRGRKPDLTVYLPGRRRPPARGLIRVPPDIAIEIVSPTPRDGRRDRVEKLADYAAFGVAWYWLLDPQLRSLEVLELDSQGRYLHVFGASTGTLEKVPGCEGLTLDLDALWAAIDSLDF
ncbi:MAG TPA: Uma2 family endonuclease [Thermoanaerobaculia bacterium]|nr:Uma2 family endonuclease [Thermoanaerobaculia bacterium]